MLKRKVIAFDVQNLTDARYFAAWGVDYLHFDLDHVSLDMVKQIVDWVSGVHILVSGEHDINELETLFEQGTYWVESKHELKTFISPLDDQGRLKIFEKSQNMDLDLDAYYLVPNDFGIADMDQLGDKIGLAITGGAEEKVGFKSYESLDVLFEHLEE